jgi:hypothetical protein
MVFISQPPADAFGELKILVTAENYLIRIHEFVNKKLIRISGLSNPI